VSLCVFIGFSVILGALWSSFGLPWALNLGQTRHLGGGWVQGSLPGVKKVTSTAACSAVDVTFLAIVEHFGCLFRVQFEDSVLSYALDVPEVFFRYS